MPQFLKVSFNQLNHLAASLITELIKYLIPSSFMFIGDSGFAFLKILR